MDSVSYVFIVVFSLLLLVSLAEEEKRSSSSCPIFNCGELGYIGFPFTIPTRPECGLLIIENCSKTDEPAKRIQLGKDGPWFYITSISGNNTIWLHDNPVQISYVDHKPVQLDNRSCKSFKNLSLTTYPFLSFEKPYNQTIYKCPANQSISEFSREPSLACNFSNHPVTYYFIIKDDSTRPPPQCSLVPFRVNKTQKSVDFLNLFTGWFDLQVQVQRECYECYNKGGQCQSDSKRRFNCSNTTKRTKIPRAGDGRKLGLKLGLGLGIGGLIVLLVLLSIYIIRYRRKRKYASPSFNIRYTSSDPSSKSELEVGNAYFEVPIFSYIELADATNNFNHEKELGDGGFGMVYYAKLRDGREAAVKRLYEHNNRRVEQFMNEVEILTRLRHKNLVSLYGCTSRHSQQGLLLVYEYVPNGTVADHLHGDRAKPGSFTWPIRMNIAIETASALAYLHASNIIHRDIKTSNILLDNNFCVKVADFGLCRLFPNDVTHVSTAPLGSPGYVDPEYYQYYQLTDKSDVYSFGVVLIELISSMPAFDISRHRDEVNLANVAINKIKKSAIEDLVDPSLGYQSDEEVKRMTTSVAELAFLCLQQIKEMRPSMDAVLEELKRIESGESKLENLQEEKDTNDVLKNLQPPPSTPDCDNLALLKHMRVPPSPISVTEKWFSCNTTPNVSI